MSDLVLRETNILKIITESLAKLSVRNNIAIFLRSSARDEAVWIDHEKIITTLFDLGKNAVEAMPDGGNLTVMVTGDERRVFITLADTGKGIAAENIPLLFTPFFTTKPVGDGTGLGLPRAYATVKAHGGEISIESNVDLLKGPTGTTVRLSLPRRMILQKKLSEIIVHDEE